MDLNQKKYIKYKTKFLNLVGGFKVSPNKTINICPNDCHDIDDIFTQINDIVKFRRNPGNMISIIVPGNAGQPGGGHGAIIYEAAYKYAIKSSKLDLYKQDILKFIKTNLHNILPYLIIREIGTNKTPLEEQIMRCWLTETMSGDKKHNNIYNNSIGLMWGCYKNKHSDDTGNFDVLSPDTIQGINYTVKENNPEKYNLAYSIEGVDIKTKIGKQKDIDLLFTFAPNHNTKSAEFRTMLATYDPNHDIPGYTNTAIHNCIKSCLLQARQGYVLLPFIGSGVYSLVPWRDKTPEEKYDAIVNYIEIVRSVLMLKELENKWLSIYLMFFGIEKEIMKAAYDIYQ